MKRRAAVCVAVAVLCWAQDAGADGLRLHSPAKCTTQGGSEIDLAPGRYLPEPDWTELDTEIRRLQEAETRLTAERNALRDTGGPTWWVLGLAFAAGIGAGAYASYRL